MSFHWHYSQFLSCLPLNVRFQVTKIILKKAVIGGTHKHTHTHLVVLNKVDKRGPLHLHRLAVPVVQRQDKVEKVGLAEVGGRLFLKMSPGESDPTEDAERKRCSASASKTSPSDSNIYFKCFFTFFFH